MGIPDRLLRLPFRLIAMPYVVAVAAVATLGFTTGSTPLILLAAFITLPSSIVAVPAYYLAFGLLAQIPGANPSHTTGSVACAPNGVCHESTTGDSAAWFMHVTDLVGILALIAAAVLNVALLQRLIAAKQDEADARTQPGM